MYWTVHLQGGPQRVNHAAVAVGKYIYSFGGYCCSADYEMRSKIDVHVLNTETLRWSRIDYVADDHSAIPFQRYGHTVVEYKGKIYLLGGRNDFNSSEVLHCFDVRELKWSLPEVRGAIPRATDGHTACVIGNYMYVFGGYEEETEMFAQGLHRINLNTFVWEVVETSGYPPESTDFHTASAIGSRMYVFGGRGTLDVESQLFERYSNTIVYLDTTTMRWVRPQTKGKVPCGRRSHSAVVYKDKLYILCGFNSTMDKHFADVHCFNPETDSWSEVKCIGEGPCARRRQCCCVVGDRLYLFGGTSPKPREEEELFYRGAVPDDEAHNLSDHSDLFVLDFFPTLKTLCLLKVISARLDYPWLPTVIKREISYMTTDNCPSKKSIYPRRGFAYSATSA